MRCAAFSTGIGFVSLDAGKRDRPSRYAKTHYEKRGITSVQNRSIERIRTGCGISAL
jgi:hypothetical protein